MAMYFSLTHIMWPNFKLKFVLTSTYGFKIKHRRVVISSLVTFLISVRNNACILRTGCQVRKAVLLYKLIAALGSTLFLTTDFDVMARASFLDRVITMQLDSKYRRNLVFCQSVIARK